MAPKPPSGTSIYFWVLGDPNPGSSVMGVSHKTPDLGFRTQLAQKRSKTPILGKVFVLGARGSPKRAFYGVLGQLCTKPHPPKNGVFGQTGGSKMGFWYTVGPKRAILPKMGIFDPFWALQNGYFGHFWPTVYQKAPKRGAFMGGFWSRV